jgi:hypothetical protein
MNSKNKGYYQLFMFPQGVYKGTDYLCSSLCGHKLRRKLGLPHGSCPACRLRRAFFKKIKNPIRVTPYVLLIPYYQPRFVAFAIKKLLTVAEVLSNLFL